MLGFSLECCQVYEDNILIYFFKGNGYKGVFIPLELWFSDYSFFCYEKFRLNISAREGEKKLKI